jgi:hypothetical protein
MHDGKADETVGSEHEHTHGNHRGDHPAAFIPRELLRLRKRQPGAGGTPPRVG